MPCRTPERSRAVSPARWFALAVLVLFFVWGGCAGAAERVSPEVFGSAGMKPFPVPLKGPAFRLPDRKGEERSKADYRGRVVLLNFWGSWCPPCREEFPSLIRLQEAFDSETFTVLAVTVADDPAAVERFMDGREVPFDILIDTTRRTAESYRAAGVPVTYLLDRDGRMVAGKAGPQAWDDPAVVRLIRAMVADD